MMREETDRHREGNSEIPHPTLINSAIITVLFIALPMALRIISLDPFSCIHANTKKLYYTSCLSNTKARHLY